MIKDNLRKVYSAEIIERGEGYIDNVKSCIKIKNILFAKVVGRLVYKTEVNLTDLSGKCSCPYGSNCKHAVAAYLVYKKGCAGDADEFLNYLKGCSQAELIKIIEGCLPEKPELIKKYFFRKKKDFNSFVNDFINDFSLSELENIEDNLDCLNFEQLLKILDYVIKNEDDINDKLSENYNSYDSFDDEEDILYDFEYTIKKELIKKMDSQEQLLTILKQGHMNDEIVDEAEKFFKHKALIKKSFSKEQYIRFLLNCKNPDLSEIKDNWDRTFEPYLFALPNINITLAEELANYLNNDCLRFIIAYYKEDVNAIIRYFGCFSSLKNKYYLELDKLVKILIKHRIVSENIARKLFSKESFENYSIGSIQFLLDNIKDKQFILDNINFEVAFLKLKLVIKRLHELGYDTGLIFKRKEILVRKHWTEIIEILRFVRQSFGTRSLEEFIKLHKEQFITSSTLKYNLKKEGILIQNIKGKLKLEIK